MTLHDLTAADALEYKAFFTTGLQRHPDCFGISPADEASEPFPTTGAPDSFTLGLRTEVGALAGVVSFQREGTTRERHRHRGVLFRMYVAQEFGGLGLGKQLIAEVLRRAADLPGIEKVNLVVIASNTRAQRLYEQVGFEAWGTEARAFKYGETYYDKTEMSYWLPTS
jgi:ribosomal protein S18 acetylase RimI-like enzyme